MKLNTTDFLRKSQFPLMTVLAALPIFTLVLLQNAPDALSALSLLVPLYLLGAWLCMVLPGKVRVPAGLLVCAVLLLLGFRLLPIAHGVSSSASLTLEVQPRIFCIVIPLSLCALLIHSLQFAAWPRSKEIPFNWYASGVVTYLIAQLMHAAARRQGIAVWDITAPWLTGGFILFLMLVLLSMNRATMHDAALGRQHVPASMRRRNVGVTLSILGVTLFIAFIPAITQFIEGLWLLGLRAVGAVIAFIAKLLESEDATGMGGGGADAGMLPPIEYSEPSLLAIILEKLATALAFIAAVLIILFIIRQAIRALRALIARIAARLALYMNTASQDYIDEITDTREDGGETSGSLLSRLRRRMAMVNERSLSPTQRIRHRYRLLLKKHPDWQSSSTARENLQHSTASLYEQARYSGQDMTGEEAEQFISDIRSI